MADDQDMESRASQRVGVFSSAESTRELEARSTQRDRLGGWAGTRAAVGAVAGAVIGGGGTALVATVAGAPSAAIAGAVLGAGALAGAIGGLWGAFSAVRPTDDWRAGVPDAAVPHAATTQSASRHDDQFASLGAVAVIESPAPEAVRDVPAPGAVDGLSSPSSTAHEGLSIDRFVGVVPVVVVLLPTPGDRLDVLASLEAAHLELGRRSTQLLGVLPPERSDRESAWPQAGSVPLLVDETGAIGERFGLRPLDDDLQAVVIGLDGGIKLRGGFAATSAIGSELVALVDRLRAADPAAFHRQDLHQI